MEYEKILKRFFDRTYTEAHFVEKTYDELRKLGFNDKNTIACAGVCRDEITQDLVVLIREKWGNPFNLSSLAGMFFAGKTGLKAAMNHSPTVDGKERYLFYALPHIAIDEQWRLGVCRRRGREGESTACGALKAFQKELMEGKVDISINNEDIEQSLIKMRLLRVIPYGHVPDLLEITKKGPGGNT